MDYLDGLNPEQLKAALHFEGPLLVVAGAGTGKTKVITARIANLIESKGIKPDEILALTFTEKAAAEMRERLSSILGWTALSVSTLTFNSFGGAILNEFAKHIGINVSGGLLNDMQKTLLLQAKLEELDLVYYGPQLDNFSFAQDIIEHINKLQNNNITTEQYEEFVDNLKISDDITSGEIEQKRDISNMYKAYEAVKRSTGTYDYYDQLFLPLEILQSKPNIVKTLQRKYKFILVDEYQDTSPVQDALLREIIEVGGNLFAVGDDDQAIYGFRGADITNILNFTQHYRVKLPVALVENYRSGQTILDAAYRLIIKNNPERLESMLQLNKQLHAQNNDGSVVFKAYSSPDIEQESVIEDIVRRIEGGQSPSSIAILARSNAMLVKYAKAMNNKQVPYSISTATNIFEQRELINLWHVLKWIGYQADDNAIGHILLGPFFNYPIANWSQIVRSALETNDSVENILRIYAKDNDDHAYKIIQRIDRWREWSAAFNVAQLAFKIFFEATYSETTMAKYLQEQALENRDYNSNSESRVIKIFNDLGRFYGQLDDYVTVQDLAGYEISLNGYLQRFPLPPKLEISENDGDADGVQLLTIHASKGLEFPTVYVVNTTAKSWSNPPVINGIDIPEGLTQVSTLPQEHEQRRLMYVALTRAKEELIISSPLSTTSGLKQKISPLVNELLGSDPNLSAVIGPAKDGVDVLSKVRRFFPLEKQMPAKLPFLTNDGWINLGVNALKAYDDDPHEFYLKHVLKMTIDRGWQLGFGVAIHKVVETYYRGIKAGAKPGLEELCGVLESSWSGRDFESPKQEKDAYKLAQTTVDNFWQREKFLNRNIEAIEKSVTFLIPEAKLRLSGRIDAMFSNDSGFEVRDFKTGRQRDAEKASLTAKNSFQLRTYALAVLDETGVVPSAVTLDYLVTGVEGSTVLSAKILENHRKKLVVMADAIRDRKFSPSSTSFFKQSTAEKYYGEYESGE